MVLIIRNAQIAAFKEALENQGDQRILSFVENTFPDVWNEIDRVERLNRIRQYRIRAVSNQFMNETEVTFYIAMIIMFGENFDECWWCKDVLSNSLFSTRNKVNHLMNIINEIGIFL